MTVALPMNYRNHITIEPNKRGGKPCVRGLRITVYCLLLCLLIVWVLEGRWG